MTAQQIKWAEQHDWFLFAQEGRVYCRCGYTDRDGRSGWEYADFISFSEMRAWAGY